MTPDEPQARPGRARPRRVDRAGLAVVGGFALLLLAWAVGNPLAASPDEPTHFVKAVASGYRQWTGTPLERPHPGMSARDDFLARVSATYPLPARFAIPGSLACVAFHPQRSAACQRYGPLAAPVVTQAYFSQVATYQPFLYVPLGLAARAAGNGVRGMRLARFASAGICLLLLAGAVRTSRSRPALAALLLAATPTSLFLFASVTTSGFEIAGGIGFAAATLALARGQRGTEVWLWWALAGVVLALSRPLGPLWVALDGVVLLGLIGTRAVVGLVRERPGPAIVGAGLVAAASAASLAWDRSVMPQPKIGYAQARPFFGLAVGDLGKMLNGAVGLFGWYDTPLPAVLYGLGHLLLATLLVLALVVATWRQRAVIAAALLATVGLTVAIDAFTQRSLGFVMQARYTLPFAVVVPLLCGHVLSQRAGQLPRPQASETVRRLSPRLLTRAVSGVVVGAGVLHVGAWLANSHRYAVGLSGRTLFFLTDRWSPKGGWWPWMLGTLAGGLLLVVGGLAGGAGRVPGAVDGPAVAPAVRAPAS